MIRGALLRPHPLNRRDPAGTEPEDLELPRRGRFGQKLFEKKSNRKCKRVSVPRQQGRLQM